MRLTTLHRVGRRHGPHVLITGGVHGDEFEPMAAIRRLGEDLARRDLQGRVTLVPVVNEAAFRLGERSAEDGLDLARVCPGRPDGSITERTADALARLIATADAYLDLHTGGAVMAIYPMVGYMLHPDPDVLERQRRMARSFGLPVIWGTDPNLEGRSLSVARDLRVPAIYAEFLGGLGYDRRGVEALRLACLNVLEGLGVLESGDRRPSIDPVLIEDARPASGHLQIQHPSPCEGFFEPSTYLGRRIEKGDLLGRVVDVLGSESAAVASERNGFVLALRTFPCVSPGDGLAVILETDRTPPPWVLPPQLARQGARSGIR